MMYRFCGVVSFVATKLLLKRIKKSIRSSFSCELWFGPRLHTEGWPEICESWTGKGRKMIVSRLEGLELNDVKSLRVACLLLFFTRCGHCLTTVEFYISFRQGRQFLATKKIIKMGGKYFQHCRLWLCNLMMAMFLF